MTGDRTISEGQILTGPLFNEPMRVETVSAQGQDRWTIGLVGTQTTFRRKGGGRLSAWEEVQEHHGEKEGNIRERG